MIFDPDTKEYVVYLGFTGRASSLTDAQRKTLRELLSAHNSSSCIALHNEGEGADQEFAALAKELGFRVRTTSPELKPMPRNRELVGLSAKLFACPPTDHLLDHGSGTWETVKYMWKANKPVFIVLSDGSVVSTKDQLPPNTDFLRKNIGLLVPDKSGELFDEMKTALDRGDEMSLAKSK